MEYCIIIPAYNEEENIVDLINKIKNEVDCHIAIIDDSENEKTKSLFKNINDETVHYFHRNRKLGRGSAVIYGLDKFINMNEIRCFIEMDADFSHDPTELKNNINLFNDKNLDLLIASRYKKNSKIINWPLSRRILSKFANKLARILLGVPVSDYTNGFRFYSPRAAKVVISECNKLGGGFIILSEILLVLYKKSYKISETNSIFRNRTRGESSVNINLIFNSFKGLIKLYLLKISNKI